MATKNPKNETENAETGHGGAFTFDYIDPVTPGPMKVDPETVMAFEDMLRSAVNNPEVARLGEQLVSNMASLRDLLGEAMEMGAFNSAVGSEWFDRQGIAPTNDTLNATTQLRTSLMHAHEAAHVLLQMWLRDTIGGPVDAA